MMLKIPKSVVVLILLLCVCTACGPTYQKIKPRVIKPADECPNSITQESVSIAVEPYVYSGEGLNYLEAGIHPLRIIVTNKGSQPVLLNPEQVLAHGLDGQLYLTYKTQEATQLVINSHAIEEAAKGAAAGGATGAVIGALVGLAVGAIFNVDKGKLAMAGALGGGVSGAAKGFAGYLKRLRAAAQAEISNNALRETAVVPGFTTSGWLFFPGHVALDELRIAISEVGSGGYLAFRIPVPVAPRPNVPAQGQPEVIEASES